MTERTPWTKTLKAAICSAALILLSVQIMSYSITLLVAGGLQSTNSPVAGSGMRAVVWPLPVIPYWVDVMSSRKPQKTSTHTNRGDAADPLIRPTDCINKFSLAGAVRLLLADPILPNRKP